jgi:hypothetical protein
MAGSLTISIPSLSALGVGETKRAELTACVEIIERGLQVLMSSQATSISMKDRNGTTAGTISWSMVNTA